LSSDAGTPPARGDGRPSSGSAPGRDLRDRPFGRVLLLVVVLVAALAVARTCGSHEDTVSQDEAVEIAKREVDFTPCSESGCVVVRAVQQGIPPRLVWIVGLAEELDAEGNPLHSANVVVDAATGEATRRR
jgi:hypothetical protein